MRARLLSLLGRWEAILAACVVMLVIISALTTPGFLGALNVQTSISNMSDTALMTLPVALLIIVREIDISVASIAGLSSSCAGLALSHNSSPAIAIAVALLAGLACGVFNGLCVAVLGLPSLVVTLGTLALFRGLCYVLLGSNVITAIPAALVNFSNASLLGTVLPLDILPFLAFAPVFAIALHRMPAGRRIYAIGGNPATAQYSGIRRGRIKFGLFVVSGMMSAIAGLINMGLNSQASPDALLGNELTVLTIVFLGGVSFLGGKGRMSGVVMALVLLISLTSMLQLRNVSSYAQGTAIGILLIVSLLISNMAREVSAKVSKRQGRHRNRQGPTIS
jgi:rhamnose transport system permease protein